MYAASYDISKHLTFAFDENNKLIEVHIILHVKSYALSH